MKAFVKNPPMSHAMERVTQALVAASGAVRIVDDMEQADLVVLHVVGFPETETLVQQLRAKKQKYAIIQYCIRTTQRPSTFDWLDIWKGAELVWTYYDLEKMHTEDQFAMNEEKTGGAPGMLFTLAQQGIKIYRSPLGVDSIAFRPWDVPKKYLIGTSGFVLESEGVLEANEAVRRLGGQQFHLGPAFEELENTYYKTGINDATLAQLYSQCKYIAGLRRDEGFELPAAEAILCGVRPICFDRPHYRDWYGDWAIYIPEGTFSEVADALTEQLAKEPVAFSSEDRKAAAERFSWMRICTEFWAHVRAPKPTIRTKVRKTLLWVGDAAVSTGFARSTHGALDTLKEHWDVHVLGINYYGGPHPYPYDIHPTISASQPMADFGERRLPEMIGKIKPDLVVLQNDPWNIPVYKKALGNVPGVGVIAVDGLNCRGTNLNGLKKSIFWTKFGEQEARKGGYEGLSAVIPLGVDRQSFRPSDKTEARRAIGFPEKLWDRFVVLNVNRNQPRKRMDLMISYFAQWIHTKGINDAMLFLHVAPTGDSGFDVQQLAAWHGIANRLIIAEPEIGLGAPEDILVKTYNACDIAASTTQGEGFGLTTLEAMACRKAFLGPDWAALGDWAMPAMVGVECTEIACTPNNINVIGGIASRDQYISNLDRLYRDEQFRSMHADRGFELASQAQFRWADIGARFHEELDALFFTKHSVTVAGV